MRKIIRRIKSGAFLSNTPDGLEEGITEKNLDKRKYLDIYSVIL